MRQFGRFGPLVGSIDEGTSSARFMVFAANTSEMLTYHQIPIKTYNPEDGWVEQDPMEILNTVLECIEITIDNLRKLDINPEDIVAVGIANQRETTIAWDFKTGLPLCNAIVWMDARASSVVDELWKCGAPVRRALTTVCGLPLAACFTAPKLKWLLSRCDAVKEAVTKEACKVGTVDSWLIWNLTGGSKGGLHMTDVTNASRTMLMNIVTLQWDAKLCQFFRIPPNILPTIKTSSEIYGYIVTGSLMGIPISGCLGDQQAALVGQMCLDYGQAKCTYGTGGFLLYNTGTSIVRSQNGLITTVAYKMGADSPTIYALEGSMAVTGAAVQWMQDGLEISGNPDEDFNSDDDSSRSGKNLDRPRKELMRKLGSGLEDEDSDREGGEVYFVPAFTGLYSPYWSKDARSMICGISMNTGRSQMLRGALRASGLQTRAILQSLAEDCGRPINRLLADGSASANNHLMQALADVCGIPIVRPVMAESSALGAAMAAGSAAGINVWPKTSPPLPSDTFFPITSEDECEMMYVRWKMAIERSIGWAAEELPSFEHQDDNDIIERRVVSSIAPGLFFVSSCIVFLLASRLTKDVIM